MDDIRHIVAATDLSTPSLQALERGFRIAEAAGARYTVLHALGLDALGPLRELVGEDAERVSQRAVEQQRAALEALLGDPARHRGVRAELRVEPGLATRVVPAFIDSARADLAVLGARGESAARRLLLGSTASRVIRKSRCPVLVVRKPAGQAYRRVLVPVDFSPGSALCVRAARAIAPGAEIVLLNVIDVPFEGMLFRAGASAEAIHHYRDEARRAAFAAMRALAAGAALPEALCSLRVQAGDAAAVILEHEKDGCELVVMGKHGTHVAEELLLGSVTKHVLDEGESDLLVVVDRNLPQPPQ